MFLNLLNQLCPQPMIATFRNQRQIDQANFIRTLLNGQTAGGLAVEGHYLVDHIRVVRRQKISLCLMLHLEKLTDAIFAPAQFPQIVAAAALVKPQEKILICRGDRS